MAYDPPETPNIIFNFTTTPYTPPATPDVVFEMTTEDDTGGGISFDPRRVQFFIIT